MRVFLITTKLNFETMAGSVVDLHLKALGLQELGYDVTVVTTFSQNNRLAGETLPYRLCQEFIVKPGLLSRHRAIVGILKKYQDQADVFYIDAHVFLYGAGLYRRLGGTTPVLGFFNVKLTPWTYSRETTRPGILTRFKRGFRVMLERTIGVWCARGMDILVFNTPMVAELYNRFGLERGKTHIVPDFAHTQAVIDRAGWNSEAITKHHNNAQPVKIFCSGRLIPDKGFDLVFKALAPLKDKYNFSLTMSGDGPDASRLKQLAQDLGLTDRVRFPGWVEKDMMLQLAREAHIFVFPRWWIEYGSVMLTECLATGLPSIIPRGGGLEWVAGGAALGFEENNIEQLTQRIEQLLHNQALRIKLAEQGLHRAHELNYTHLAKDLAEVIEKVGKK